MLLSELRDIVGGIFNEAYSTSEAVEAIIHALEESDEVELLKDEMKLVVVIRKPAWRNLPFPAIDTIDGALHSGAYFDRFMEFEFHMYHPGDDE